MREWPLPGLLAALTPRRAATMLQTALAGAASRLSGRPIARGAPWVLSIEPTSHCDLRCPQCETGAGTLRRPRGFMELELYRHILKANQHHLLCLMLYDQGEPLLHPDFGEMVRLAKAHRLCVISSTNGQRLADREVAAEIVASGLDALIISADGITPESYARYRRGGSLDKVVAGIGHVRELRRAMGRRTPQIYLQFVVMRHNEAELAHLPEVVQKWGADRLLCKSLYLRQGTEVEVFLPAAEKFRRYHLAAGRWVRKGAPRRSCPRLGYSAVIHWDGNVVPCCFDKEGEYPLGHASAPLAELWRGKAWRQFRLDQSSLLPPPICENCSDGLKIYPT